MESRARARNTAADAENKIHDDRVAAAYGFRGGLVPGVTIYGYMIPVVLERWGQEWLSHGRINVRFQAPFYEGEWVVSRCDGREVRAEREDGTLCALGQVSVGVTQPMVFPSHPLPAMADRPAVTALQAGMPLGSILERLDVADATGIPEALLWMANRILVRNFEMGPWIHVASEVQHHGLAKAAEEITVNGAIQECFERKTRKFAVAELAMEGAGAVAVASVRHTFIYGLQPVILDGS